jgi:hypothetical protein
LVRVDLDVAQELDVELIRDRAHLQDLRVRQCPPGTTSPITGFAYFKK